MSEHTHPTVVPGCYRCELSRGEVEHVRGMGPYCDFVVLGRSRDIPCMADVVEGRRRCEQHAPFKDSAYLIENVPSGAWPFLSGGRDELRLRRPWAVVVAEAAESLALRVRRLARKATVR